MSATIPSKFAPLGQIRQAHGVHGAVKVHSYTEPPEALLGYRQLYLLPEDQPEKALVVTQAKAGPGGLLIFKFKHLTTRDEAETLAGAWLGLRRSDLPPPDEDEYYWQDLLGLEVFDRKAGPLGTVSRIFEAGAGPVLEVVAPDQPEILAPFNQDTLVEVELTQGRLQVDLPPGLLEVYRPC